jgi:hypothetical protein
MGKLRGILLLSGVSFLLVFAILGCGKPTPPPPEKGVTKSENENPKITGGQSLSSDDYIRLGLPAPDRDWSSSDMIKAGKVLSALAKKGFENLPRYKSKGSGEVFTRMTSPQNLEIFKNRSLPVEARMPQALDYMEASNKIAKLYLGGAIKKEIGSSEVVELLGMQLRISVVMVQLVDEFLPTLKKDDPKHKVRMQGLEQMKRGLASVVMGGLKTLTEREMYGSGELLKLVGYMDETFPLIVPKLPPGSRSEMMIRLEELQKDPAMKDLQTSLQELHKKVTAALKKG